MKTLLSVHCYAGDAELVRRHLPVYEHHGYPIVILSPWNSRVTGMGPHICGHAGLRAYIGQDSLDRQIEHLRILLSYDFDFYFMCDPDSFCVAPTLPPELFEYENTLWSNQVQEPRPHSSPYKKLAFQPPYFCSRGSLEKLLGALAKIPCHPITPFIDFFMVAAASEAGLADRAFTELERQSTEPFTGSDPWDTLRFRIERQGHVMQHPIKEGWQLALCIEARKKYEQTNI